jgi:hypothetical protein
VRTGGVEPGAEMMLDPGIQGADDRVEWIFAHALTFCVEELRQSGERRICHFEIERSVSDSEHPAVKAVLARLPSEPWRQMKHLPGDHPVNVLPVVIRVPAHQRYLGKRRSKRVAADTGQSPAIPEDEEMIDERAMAVHRLQFDINSRIGLLGFAAATRTPVLETFAAGSATLQFFSHSTLRFQYPVPSLPVITAMVSWIS